MPQSSSQIRQCHFSSGVYSWLWRPRVSSRKWEDLVNIRAEICLLQRLQMIILPHLCINHGYGFSWASLVISTEARCARCRRLYLAINSLILQDCIPLEEEVRHSIMSRNSDMKSPVLQRGASVEMQDNLQSSRLASSQHQNIHSASSL